LSRTVLDLNFKQTVPFRNVVVLRRALAKENFVRLSPGRGGNGVKFMVDDAHLIRAWAKNRDEEAFRTLVDRHLNLVYSVAKRILNNDEHLADEVAQGVFIVLARKAPSFPRGVILPAWLYRTTQYAAAQAIRAEARRTDRHKRYFAMQTPEANAVWENIAPGLEPAMARLRAKEREALVLRFMGEMTIEQVGASLGISEEAARKRIDRALEKLRAVLLRGGASTSLASLAALLSANALQAAPAGLSAKVATASLAPVAAASMTTASIATGTIQFMAWTKAKMAGIAAGVLLLCGVTTVVVKESAVGDAIGGDDPVENLRTQLAAAGGTPEQIDNLVCVDNLKKIGAALANGAANPTDPLVFKNQLDTPRRFHCPKDSAKAGRKQWSQLKRSDVSYLLTGAPSRSNPSVARCPIHGHAVMPNGQVIQGVMRN
jgi:RNA polymerase sigma factor (sigma-70 family)